uniref:hypothetical protein n=1 Tax=Methanocella arvoryzae TaxID=1175445 RepID=UPI0003253597|nr:hypothetical protein [Methanocella arvoryzae]
MFGVIAYGTKEHVELIYPICLRMINRINRRNTKKELLRYQIQEYISFHDIILSKLYKNRMHCE